MFSFAGRSLGIVLVGKVFKKTFRIEELDDRKYRWVVEEDFHWNFRVTYTRFLALFSGPFD